MMGLLIYHGQEGNHIGLGRDSTELPYAESRIANTATTSGAAAHGAARKKTEMYAEPEEEPPVPPAGGPHVS